MTTGWKLPPSRLSPPPTPATRMSASPVWSGSAATCSSANGLTASRSPGSSPAARPLSGTGRASCSSVSCSRVLRGSGSCTPIRTRATSGCLPTGGSACSTSAPSTGYQTASRPSSAGCYGSCTKAATSPSLRRRSGRTAISGTASALTWQRCAPSWHRSPSRPRRSRSGSAANGCAPRQYRHQPCAHPACCGGSTCRPLTCSSTGYWQLAWACSASSNARRRSALKCSGGCPDTRTRLGSRHRRSRPVPGRLPQPDPRRQPPPTGTPDPRRQPPPTGAPRSAPPAGPQEQARSVQPAGAEPRVRTAQPAQPARPVRPEQIENMVVRAGEGHHG